MFFNRPVVNRTVRSDCLSLLRGESIGYERR